MSGDVSIRVPEGSEDFSLSASVTASEANGSTATTTTGLDISVPEASNDDANQDNSENNADNSSGHGDSSGGHGASATDAENENVNNDGYRSFDEAKSDMGGNAAFSKDQGGHGSDNLDGNNHAWKTGGKELYEGNEGNDVVGNQWNNYGDDLMAGGADDDGMATD